jgi:nitrite reductase (NAD(P)H)
MGVQVLTFASPKALILSETEPDTFVGLELQDGTKIDAQMVVYAIGITPRDDLARRVGIRCEERRGIVVDDYLNTSAKDVFAIGECASWNKNTYGLIAPGSEYESF